MTPIGQSLRAIWKKACAGFESSWSWSLGFCLAVVLKTDWISSEKSINPNCNLLMNCLIVLDHFMGLALKGLRTHWRDKHSDEQDSKSKYYY